MAKVAQFFLLFLNICMEGWGLLFKVRKHLVWSGGGQSGQTCPNFIRGGPCQEHQEGKILVESWGWRDWNLKFGPQIVI